MNQRTSRQSRARGERPMEVIEHPYLSEQTEVRHGLFTRNGGVSRGLFESLNCGFGSGDDPEAVAENRARAAGHLGLASNRLLTAYQTHGVKAVAVESAWSQAEAPKADILVTRSTGIALGVLTADCAPVLFAEPQARVVGIAHAGWRGALAGVVEAAVEAMVSQGARPEAIIAVIGPCIAQGSYEVGPEFIARFTSRDEACRDLFRPSKRPGHHLFDLPGYLARRLARLGLKAVAATGHDTASDAQCFFSYRRAVSEGEPEYGRGLSAIVLKP